ncbi:hypothetical protein SOM70_37540 [Streptomyces salinarius]|uniref:hypothetical protein n=1 Tax=Streptomyces salinarius TaxID=2762598 RepID=UPI0032DFC596
MKQGDGSHTPGNNRVAIRWRQKRDRVTAWWQRHRKAIVRRFVFGVAGGTGSGCVTLLVLYVQHRV